MEGMRKNKGKEKSIVVPQNLILLSLLLQTSDIHALHTQMYDLVVPPTFLSGSMPTTQSNVNDQQQSSARSQMVEQASSVSWLDGVNPGFQFCTVRQLVYAASSTSRPDRRSMTAKGYKAIQPIRILARIMSCTAVLLTYKYPSKQMQCSQT